MSTLGFLLSEQMHYEAEEAAARERLQQTPEGTLICYRTRSGFKYYKQIQVPSEEDGQEEKLKNKRILLSTEEALPLAEKARDRKILLDCREELNAISAYLKKTRNFAIQTEQFV